MNGWAWTLTYLTNPAGEALSVLLQAKCDIGRSTEKQTVNTSSKACRTEVFIPLPRLFLYNDKYEIELLYQRFLFLYTLFLVSLKTNYLNWFLTLYKQLIQHTIFIFTSCIWVLLLNFASVGFTLCLLRTVAACSDILAMFFCKQHSVSNDITKEQNIEMNSSEVKKSEPPHFSKEQCPSDRWVLWNLGTEVINNKSEKTRRHLWR